MITERSIVDQAKRWIKKQPDMWAFKVAGGLFQHRGVADLVGHVGGRFLWAEAKRPGERLTLHQEAMAKELEKTGVKTFVFHSLDEFKSIVEELRKT